MTYLASNIPYKSMQENRVSYEHIFIIYVNLRNNC